VRPISAIANAIPDLEAAIRALYLDHRSTSTIGKNLQAMSISENSVRRSDAKPMKPAQPRRQTMRVMVFVKATDDSEKGILPTTEALEAMGRYNAENDPAEGLRPSWVRVLLTMRRWGNELVA
jgi:hypothetical protein